MRYALFGIWLGAVFIFGGCSTNELSVSKYYTGYTKDDILLAGKYAFLADKNHEYIVDSYRDRLEATEIDLIFNTLVHYDYVLKTEEDACGTRATVTLGCFLGVDKSNEYINLQNNHIEFLKKIEFFIDKSDLKFVFLEMDKKASYKNLVVEPTKDMSTCVIKDEFENSIIIDNTKDRFGADHENY